MNESFVPLLQSLESTVDWYVTAVTLITSSTTTTRHEWKLRSTAVLSSVHRRLICHSCNINYIINYNDTTWMEASFHCCSLSVHRRLICHSCNIHYINYNDTTWMELRSTAVLWHDMNGTSFQCCTLTRHEWNFVPLLYSLQSTVVWYVTAVTLITSSTTMTTRDFTSALFSHPDIHHQNPIYIRISGLVA